MEKGDAVDDDDIENNDMYNACLIAETIMMSFLEIGNCEAN